MKNSAGGVHCPAMRNETVTSAVVLACSSAAVVVLKMVMQVCAVAVGIVVGRLVVDAAVIDMVLGAVVEAATCELVDPAPKLLVL